MCGRYDLHTSAREIARLVGIEGQVGEYGARYNIAPGTPILNVNRRIRGTPCIESLLWGLTPHWAPADWDGPRPINARADKLQSSGMYRNSLRGTHNREKDRLIAGRTLIFADGFYEPDKKNASRSPYPQYYFYARERQLLAFAGLFAHWQRAPDEPMHISCAIITTEPNQTVGAVHPRMPAILPAEHWTAWLDPDNHDADALARLLGPAPEDLLDGHRVDDRLLSRRDSDGHWVNDARLIEPVDG